MALLYSLFRVFSAIGPAVFIMVSVSIFSSLLYCLLTTFLFPFSYTAPIFFLVRLLSSFSLFPYCAVHCFVCGFVPLVFSGEGTGFLCFECTFSSVCYVLGFSYSRVGSICSLEVRLLGTRIISGSVSLRAFERLSFPNKMLFHSLSTDASSFSPVS